MMKLYFVAVPQYKVQGCSMRTCGKGLLLLTVMIVQVHWTAAESVMVVMFILRVGCCVAPYQWTFQVPKKISNICFD
jgi:hypothetical protein